MQSVLTKEEFNEYEKKVKEESKQIAEKTAERISKEGLIFEAELNNVKCIVCGHLNPFENKFCSDCGNDLREDNDVDIS